MTNAVNARELSLEIIVEVLEKGGYSHVVLRSVLDKYAYLDKRERAFISRLSEGTIEYQIQLDAVLNRFSKVPVYKMKALIRNLLRMSLYQILYMDSVPDSAVCNEAVKLAQKKGFHGLKGFVNGVLRSILREKEQLTFSKMSEKYSMPQWIIDEWRKEYPDEIVEDILQQFLRKRPLSIRCNINKISRDELAKRLEGEGITVYKPEFPLEALEIEGFDAIGELKAFREGLFQVQDISSMLVGKVAAPKMGDYIIDVCAAPGGKAIHLAELLDGTGKVEARDLTEYKVSLIQENIDRSGMKNIHAVCMDALQYDAASEGTADIVIADLPCSGLGVIGKKPDIKYRMTMNQIQELQQLQREILHTIHTYPKTGGVLIYSTCTISRKENLENVEWFLENHPYELEGIENCVSEKLYSDTKEKGYLQLIPGIHNTDGFFIAKLKRKG